ncbi:MAG TPA: NUDIX hydrolase [Thermoanaerobaculia bacterium]|jgi:8-oxo-dGTP pyrophosphatase MutT (NUDIX family)|nr:NUDIX hydrolase [Thermoanaerobaculia bacterium]
MRTERQRSAGGLVVEAGQILLISTRSGRRWQLPKGHIEIGETPEQAAVREIREETGVTGRIVAPLPGVEYWYVERGQARIHKTVDYFLLDYIDGTTEDFDASEVSGASWFPWDEGISRLSFDNERQVVSVARELRENGMVDPDLGRVRIAAGSGASSRVEAGRRAEPNDPTTSHPENQENDG